MTRGEAVKEYLAQMAQEGGLTPPLAPPRVRGGGTREGLLRALKSQPARASQRQPDGFSLGRGWLPHQEGVFCTAETQRARKNSKALRVLCVSAVNLQFVAAVPGFVGGRAHQVR